MYLLKDTTKLTYCVNNEYTKQRKKLHQDIINKIIKDSPSENPEAFLLGGGSASGKSFISTIFLQAYKDAGKTITYIDSDDIKNFLPEYLEMVESGIDEFVLKAAAFVHDESSDIAETIINICINKKLHFIYDGTMKNAEKYKNIIIKLKNSSYIIHGVIVHVPLNVAFERAEIRFKAEGRKVPDIDIIESHENVAITFSMIYKDFDTYIMYDNSTKPAVPFAVKDSKDLPEKIINPIKFFEFFNKTTQKV